MKPHPKGIAPPKADAYRNAFVTHVHILLWMGYSRLKRSALPALHEPEISGLICESIEAVFDDAQSPRWVDDYEIHDDPPVHDHGRLGKHRRRVDIKLKSRRSRPRLRFCFEAKSLKTSGSVSEYLGKDGLGRFLDGSYSSDQAIGGMIAYVQTNNCDGWCSKISAKLDRETHKLGCGGMWTLETITNYLPHTYRTIHKRARSLANITIIHTLLDCTGA